MVLENGKPKFAETLEEKIQMYLQVLLRTELDKYEIYSGTGFGMTYFAFRGKKIPNSIVISEIKREITEKLKKITGNFKLVDTLKKGDFVKVTPTADEQTWFVDCIVKKVGD